MLLVASVELPSLKNGPADTQPGQKNSPKATSKAPQANQMLGYIRHAQ
jgi:hypothetical protein